MERVFLLTEIECGKSAVIYKVNTPGPLGKRLRDLGFVNGACVCPLFSGNGLRAYAICGTVIALRNCDAKGVEVFNG